MKYVLILLLAVVSLPVGAEENISCSYEDTRQYVELYQKINVFFEVVKCLENDFKVIEQKRLEVEEKRIEKAREIEAVVTFDGDIGKLSQKFEKSKLSFEKYRMEECGTNPFSNSGVSYAAIKKAACPIIVTKHRIEILEQE